VLGVLKRFLLGRPLPTWQARHERLGKATALAVFSSDNLSSVAYATEEILLVLVLAGAGALPLSLPIAIAIALLMAIVVSSYWHTVHAYPMGGGTYIVAKENLGRFPSLVAGAALLTDYVLTVSVSVAAGVAAITSAFPALYPERILLCLLCVWGITLGNLRGVRESGRIFAGPTYLFIATMALLLTVGLWRWGTGSLAASAPVTVPPASQAVTLFLLLRAFASGCAAMTGIEAIADGAGAFRPPEGRNAGLTLLWMAGILITTFLGVTFLARAIGLSPREGETIVSMLARATFGATPFYYLVQGATAAILILAANTSFADFPRLSYFIARDGYLPRQFTNRGDRLVFSNGILVLGVLSSALLVAFRGDTHALIPLYALGVFLSFTLSQAGMVQRWRRERGPHWLQHATINGLGALATGCVLVVIGATKFIHGAWIVVLLIPGIVFGFLTVHRHYDALLRQLSLESLARRRLKRHTVLVLVAGLHRGVLDALDYGKAISPDVQAVTVDLDSTATANLQRRWQEWVPDIPLIALDSPYRSVLQPVLEYVDKVQQGEGTERITIILPEFVPARWWQHLLHNQTALLIKGAMLFRRGTVVISVPYHLEA
jgi:amino acid transporter